MSKCNLLCDRKVVTSLIVEHFIQTLSTCPFYPVLSYAVLALMPLGQSSSSRCSSRIPRKRRPAAEVKPVLCPN